MRPVLVQIGNIRLMSSTVFLDLAVLVGLWVAYRLARRYRLPQDSVLDAALLGIVAGMVGARAHFVLANWDYYAVRTGEILQFWKGGMAFGGGLIAGIAACWAFARARRVNVWDLLDPLAPALAIGSALAWVGNLLAGSAYGRPGRGLGYLFLPDIYGYVEYRFATQAVAAVVYALIFALVWYLLHRRPWPGSPFATYLALVGATQFALEFTRGDDTLLIGGLRLAQWLDAAAVIAGLILIMALRRHARPAAKTMPSEEVSVG
ncbi:MAG: prolipoprotein diacylglyceryl transferase [Anaerolineae bacterium]|nr:prolipoprotein diacylglyceryl transferase [Anaerolineae bacterium]